MCLSLRRKCEQAPCQDLGNEKHSGSEKISRKIDKVNAWCAMSVHKVFGSYCFYSPIVIDARYMHFLSIKFLPMLPCLPSDTFIQQYMAPPHYSLDMLRCWMRNYQICKKEEEVLYVCHLGPQIWLLLNFLLEYVKDEGYQTHVPYLAQLKRRITSAVRSVDADLVQNMWNNSQARPQTVIRVNGGRFEHILHPIEAMWSTEYHQIVRIEWRF